MARKRTHFEGVTRIYALVLVDEDDTAAAKELGFGDLIPQQEIQFPNRKKRDRAHLEINGRAEQIRASRKKRGKIARKRTLNGFPAIEIQNPAELQVVHEEGYLNAKVGSLISFPDETTRDNSLKRWRKKAAKIPGVNHLKDELWNQAFQESL